MGTVVIKVSKESGGRYPVEIYVDDGAADWLRRPRESSHIPTTLACEGGPEAIGEAEARSVLRQDGEQEQLEQVGQYLYLLLFSGEVGEVWNRARQSPCNCGKRETLTILDIEPPRLRSLPWELLTTTDDEPQRLFCDPDRPFIRGRLKEGACPASTQEWPLRALIVVGSPADDKVIKDDEAREEVTTILGALREMGRTAEAEVLFRPSKRELLRSYAVFKPHIFHFIGHAGPTATDAQASGSAPPSKRRPYLKFFDDAAKAPWEWSVADIGSDLKGKHAASFALISACRTNEAVTPGHTQTITGAFAATGIPAVVGMLGDVRDDVAQAFAGGLYEALADGKPVDVALARARQSVNESRNDIGVTHRHWALPSLSVTAHPDTILAIRPSLDPTRLQRFKTDEMLSELRGFVDRQDQRRSLTHIDPYHEPANKSLLLVRGESGVGKTALVQLFLECCAMRGRKILWVNMHGPTPNFIQVLCSISAGDPDSRTLLGYPLEPQDAFNQFHWELPHLLDNNEPPRMEPDKIHGPPDWDKQIWKGGDISYLNRIVNRFKQALVKVAGDRPLIIALDHVRFAPNEFETYVFPRLIRPISRHELAPVRMIMVLSPAVIEQYNLDDRSSPFYIGDKVSLPKFVSDDFEYLAYEFFRYNKLTRDKARKAIRSIVESYSWANHEWTPTQLVDAWRGMSR